MSKGKLPSPALVVSLVSLFVALSGTAFAVGDKIVPHAKLADVALVANNAKKLGGQTADQLTAAAVSQASQAPGPASTAAGLVVVKTAPWNANAGGQGDFVVTCDAGSKAIAGGWEDPVGWGHSWDSRPTPDDSGWKTFITVSTNAPGPQTGTVYAICLK